MARRSAIVISYHFPPSLSPGSLRMTSLVRRMVRDEWDVHVITARRASEQHADADSAGTIPETISVERTGSIELYRRIHSGLGGGKGPAAVRWLRRLSVVPLLPLYPFSRFPDKQVGWTLPLFFALRRALRSRSDAVVLSSSPPHSCQVPIALLRRLTRFHWVVDFRDPWTAPVRQPRGAFSRWCQRRLESSVLGRADRIIVNTPGNRRALLEAFPSVETERVHVVTNGYDPDLTPSGAVGDTVADSADIVYVGEIYPGMLDLYLRSVGIMAEGGGAVPELHVYGIFDDREKEAVRAAGLEAAVVHQGVVSWQRSLEIMRGAPALLLLLQHHERWRSCVPSKLYPYLYSGSPVLALVPAGDASEILDRAGAGIAVTSDQPSQVAAEMQRFFDSPSSSSTRRNREAIERYDMNHLSAEIQRIMRGEGEEHGG